MASTRLNGGMALMTGAASGIGKDVCFALAEAGVEAILLADLNLPTDLTLQECQMFASHSNFRALSVMVDVTDEASVDNMVQRAVSELGEPHSDTSTRSNMTRSLGRGSIVMLSSINGLISVPGMMPHTASKHATIGIAQTAAVDNFEHHVRVNIV
ncbi:hypothetical protein CBS147353_11896 [Aspergillus niger]|nr:hypothetical protein CBS147353_11896 [Aspergillus niger]